MSATYAPPLQQLLTLGSAHDRDVHEDPAYKVFTADHISALLAMANDPDLLAKKPFLGEPDKPEENPDPSSWAPVHALRALGLIRDSKVIPDILTFMTAHDADDYLLAGCADALDLIGIPAIEPLIAAFNKGGGDGFIFALCDVFQGVGFREFSVRDQIISALTEKLKNPDAMTSAANSYVVTSLCELEAVESSSVVKAAYDAGKVDELVMSREEAGWQMGFGEKPALHIEFTCDKCSKKQTRIAGYSYFVPEQERAGLSWDGYIPCKSYTCYGCREIDQYTLTQSTVDRLNEIFRAQSEDDEDPRVLAVKFTLRDGTLGRRASQIIQDRLDWAESDPNNLKALRDLAFTAEFFDEKDLAMESWERVGNLDEDAFDAPYNIGRILCDSDDWQTGRDFLEEALIMLPHCSNAPKGQRSHTLEGIVACINEYNDESEEPDGLRIVWNNVSAKETKECEAVIDTFRWTEWQELGEFLEANQIEQLELAPESEAANDNLLREAITLWQKRRKNPFAGMGWRGSSKKRRKK